MPEYTYLIIGGGMTADAAVKGIRQEDDSGSIGMLSTEPDPPYNRPPLSKGLWKGMKEKFIWRNTDSQDVTLHLSTRAVAIDPDEKVVRDDAGGEYRYGKLLLAAGGSPIHLPDAPEDLIYFRTYQDYQTLAQKVESLESFAVIGGGFIGSEIAAALNEQEKRVTIIFPESGLCGRIFPDTVSQFLNSYYQEKGVHVLSGELVSSVTKAASRYQVTTHSGTMLKADTVIAGLGITPNTGLAEAAGLEIDNGIIVNEYLQTSRPDIYAAGDVARFYNAALGKRIRVEHEENANMQGLTAGLNMAGAAQSYSHLPSFYSDLFDLSYQAVGEMRSDMEIVEDWKTEFREGTIYYLQDGRIRGVALWNIWRQLDNARELIAAPGPFGKEDVKGRLPD